MTNDQKSVAYLAGTFAAGFLMATLWLGVYQISPGSQQVVYRLNRLTGSVDACILNDTCSPLGSNRFTVVSRP